MILTILGGLASVLGFAIAGGIADKIGRKWTISTGLMITFAGLILMCFVRPTEKVAAAAAHGEFTFPVLLYAVWVLKGFGMALVHNCSFPMVVELCSAKKIGKFTGYYYAASMSAQTVTPVLLGLVLKAAMAWRALPVYACILTLLSCTVFTSLVKNIKAGKVANVTGLEALGGPAGPRPGDQGAEGAFLGAQLRPPRAPFPGQERTGKFSQGLCACLRGGLRHGAGRAAHPRRPGGRVP